MNVLRFPAKSLRSRLLVKHVREAGYRGVVIFSCGNAAKYLREQLQGRVEGNHLSYEPLLVEISPKGPLAANRWWTPEEIHRSWPDLFDATPGHLSAPLMVELAHEYRRFLTDDPARYAFLESKRIADGPWHVPTGSGETIICLRIAFPHIKFIAAYDSTKPATTRDGSAPLNRAVDALFPVEYLNGQL